MFKIRRFFEGREKSLKLKEMANLYSRRVLSKKKSCNRLFNYHRQMEIWDVRHSKQHFQDRFSVNGSENIKGHYGFDYRFENEYVETMEKGLDKMMKDYPYEYDDFEIICERLKIKIPFERVIDEDSNQVELILVRTTLYSWMEPQKRGTKEALELLIEHGYEYRLMDRKEIIEALTKISLEENCYIELFENKEFEPSFVHLFEAGNYDRTFVELNI